jgi:hypothetical protein
VSGLLWILFALVYIAMLVFLGLTTLRKGHTFLFFAGLFLPLFWIAGALLPPTSAAQASAARSDLH